jgi:hypothetical protein
VPDEITQLQHQRLIPLELWLIERSKTQTVTPRQVIKRGLGRTRQDPPRPLTTQRASSESVPTPRSRGRVARLRPVWVVGVHESHDGVQPPVRLVQHPELIAGHPDRSRR